MSAEQLVLRDAARDKIIAGVNKPGFAPNAVMREPAGMET
jgi:hypothetical protein